MVQSQYLCTLWSSCWNMWPEPAKFCFKMFICMHLYTDHCFSVKIKKVARNHLFILIVFNFLSLYLTLPWIQFLPSLHTFCLCHTILHQYSHSAFSHPIILHACATCNILYINILTVFNHPTMCSFSCWTLSFRLSPSFR